MAVCMMAMNKTRLQFEMNRDSHFKCISMASATAAAVQKDAESEHREFLKAPSQHCCNQHLQPSFCTRMSILRSLFVLLLVVCAAHALMPRQKAPDFHNLHAVVDKQFARLSLSDYAGKWLVLISYPFDFTFVCPTELIAFSDRLAEFRSLGAEVVGFSTDSHHTHLAWINTPRSEGGVGNMAYPLIADISKEMSRAYGVLVEDRTDDMFGAALRGLFVIDPKGVVRSVTINDDSVGRNVDETLRIVKAFQHADAHGVVCPANWQPGEATIVPDQTAKMTFFHDSYPSKK